MNQRSITLYLHVHQPWRIRDYSVFDIANTHDYFDGQGENERNNRAVLEKVADKSYRPMNALLLRLLNKNPEFKVSLSITGTFLEQAERWTPDVIRSFQQLVATGQVEILAETYFHSLAFFYNREEFERQVEAHRNKVRELFGVETKVFRNTELAYNDELAHWADMAGYKGIVAEGWDPVLDWRSPNYVYQPSGTKNISLLLKNYRLSDDLAFRFGNKQWADWPLRPDTYARWVDDSLGDGQSVNLFMDYETFGEHQWSDTGIFDFFASFVSEWVSQPNRVFKTVSETLDAHQPVGELSMPQTVTWADTERDLSAWLGNSLQTEALGYLYDMQDSVLRSGDEQLIHDWRLMQTSDHVYYMCTKWFSDGDVHAYFSPYESPYDAYLYFMNALRDLRYRVMKNLHGGIYG